MKMKIYCGISQEGRREEKMKCGNMGHCTMVCASDGSSLSVVH